MASRYPIIVEGPDGSGKTTLAEKLCEKYDLEYRRPAPEDLSSTDGPGGMGLWEWWDHELAVGDPDVVYDRCAYISDPIYATKRLIDGKMLANGVSNLWALEPIIIFCLPPFEIQLANVNAEGRDKLRGFSDEDLEKVNYRYWASYALWREVLFSHVKAYDYTKPSTTLFEWLEDAGVNDGSS